jgi:glycosyltransferase involved in cell wall biosynthesis
MATTPNAPKISIGMPVYNGEKCIREALDALLAQTFTDFELIISDNASTDDTGPICREYATRDARVRYIRQPENKGVFANFQFVLNEAVGEYFMWNAADDFRSKDCIEFYLSRIGNAGGVFSTYALIDRKNGSEDIAPIPILSTNQTRRESLKRFFVKNCPSLCYGLYKRVVLKECMPREAFDWFDSYLILKVISRHGFNTEDCEPKYYAGYYGSYVPKPFHGKYIRSSKYFFKACRLAIYAGPVAFLYHLNTLRISAKLNVKKCILKQ